VASALAIYIIHLFGFKIAVKKLVTLLLIFSIGYVGIKGSAMVYRSYMVKYPYFPLVAHSNFFDHDLYEAGQWAKQNTDKDDLFLSVKEESKGKYDFCYTRFRLMSLRSVWCQDIVGAYGNLDEFREWRRRKDLLNSYIGQPIAQWDSLIDKEKINYIFSPRNLAWSTHYGIVFENGKYTIYKTTINDVVRQEN